MCRTILRRWLSEGAVHRARGGVLRVLQMVSMRMLVCMLMRMMRMGGVAVRQPRRLRMARAQVCRAPMVLERERRARRPPITAFLHVRASRRAAARAAPGTRQRMPPRLVRAPIVTLSARHPFRSPLPLSLASPPRPHPSYHECLLHTSFLIHGCSHQWTVSEFYRSIQKRLAQIYTHKTPSLNLLTELVSTPPEIDNANNIGRKSIESAQSLPICSMQEQSFSLLRQLIAMER
jgi:hypothetical protein